MFFKIERNFLIEELTKCNRIIDNKSVLSYSMGIFVECDGDCVSFSSMNSIMNIKSKVFSGQGGLEFKDTGNFLIRGKYILEILKRMDDAYVSISKIDDNLISLYGDRSEFSLNILDDSGFPTVAFKERGQIASVETEEFKKALAQTIISVNESNQKLVLTGINLNAAGESLFVTGTDGFRVSRKEIYLHEKTNEHINTNIPYKTILEIQKLLMDKGVCKISLMDNTCCFTIGNTLIQTSVLEGQYPNVEVVFPDDFATKIIVENKKISKLISRADIPSDEASATVVNMMIEGDKMIIKSNIQQIASFEEEFKEYSLEGIEEQNIYLNPRFLLDALRTFEAKTIEIQLLDEKKPIVICSEEEKTLKQVILPMSSN
ncbi:DNA polymerase III subunit beta [Spiroplasma clarkii]|uniref:DNA polymerase III subunit beta n=1 Tax=Spiroplasma clarkii TaxID=2139 RepID=A0A1Y0KYS5_9MOLU|nr:DNA polymerase III subunit beta [Spiroplasma clarkii]ARU90892.1 DNA polymerase III subunit beta [Spiroplasma clarkii]ATX70339.1 DNA polymerase III subunit beta [Spiroplasma clarkii]